MEFTGERYIPQEGQALLAAEHLSRYLACSSIARDRSVLDAACGTGYGTAMLAATASWATGIDLDPESIEYAQDPMPPANTDFYVGSVLDMPFKAGAFDLVVSFETVEHFTEQEQFIAECRRVLTDSGLLVISTPDRNMTDGQNPYHAKELTESGFVSLLRTQFPRIDLYRQAPHGLYMVAVCGLGKGLPTIGTMSTPGGIA